MFLNRLIGTGEFYLLIQSIGSYVLTGLTGSISCFNDFNEILVDDFEFKK